MGGLRDVFKLGAQTIFKAFGNVPVVTSITVYGEKTYDALLDVVVTPSTVYPNIKMFLQSYTSYEKAKGDGILPTDIKAFVAVDDLLFQPGPSNEVLITSSSDTSFRAGNVFHIVGDFEVDAAEALYVLNLRALT